MDILGVRLENLSRDDIFGKVSRFLSEEKFHQIATINPEFILTAQHDVEFKNILNGCDMNIADGAGIGFAFWSRGVRLRTRLAGVDLMNDFLRIAQEKNLGIFLAAKIDGLSDWQETASVIRNKYPKLEVFGANLDKRVSTYKMPDAKYQILFCNFGAPYQEKFLNSLKSSGNSKIKLAMGVGGSFDYLTGKLKRAPVFMRHIGLEWLWRLIQQPKRIKRIFNAVIVFPIKVLFDN